LWKSENATGNHGNKKISSVLNSMLFPWNCNCRRLAFPWNLL
jgi:hypothetical protein